MAREDTKKILKIIMDRSGKRNLKNAIEMEEKDACKRCDENATGNLEC